MFKKFPLVSLFFPRIYFFLPIVLFPSQISFCLPIIDGSWCRAEADALMDAEEADYNLFENLIERRLR